MHENAILSPLTTVPANVAVVVEYAVSFMVSVVVVTSHTEHAQPLVAVDEAPIVTTAVQEIACARNEPAVAPPVKLVGVPQPEAVNVDPFITRLGLVAMEPEAGCNTTLPKDEATVMLPVPVMDGDPLNVR